MAKSGGLRLSPDVLAHVLEQQKRRGKVAGTEVLVAKKPTAKEKLQAKGRLKTGTMNKTETRFLDEWIKPRVMAGEITWWAFEAITLKLAHDCRLTVDFYIMLRTGELQAIDVKGSAAVVQDDAMVKMKCAVEKFPFPISMVMPRKQADGGGWLFTEVK